MWGAPRVRAWRRSPRWSSHADSSFLAVFKDTQGRVLFKLRTKLLAIHKTFIAEDEAERELFTVKKKMASELP